VELADLTRGMRKNIFLEPEKMFFLQSRLCLSFIRAVWKKTFFKSLISFFAKPGLSEFHKSSAEKTFLSSLKSCFPCKAGIV